MKLGRNRPGRKDHLRRARQLALLLTSAAIAASIAAPAGAATGGASTVTASNAQEGAALAFGPARLAGATWYGPGFYGQRTACGQVLRPGTIGVAHRSLPCGTTVKFAYRGHYLVTRVIDRGPYTRGNAWDLTNGARQALGFEGAGRVRYAVALSFARR